MRERHDTKMLEQVTSALARRLEAPAKALSEASGRLDSEVKTQGAEREAASRIAILRARAMTSAGLILCLAVLAVALGLAAKMVLGVLYANELRAGEQASISAPIELPSVPVPGPESAGVVTTNFTLFRKVDTTVREQELTVAAGHHFARSTDTEFEHAWCYTDVELNDVTIDLPLGTKAPGEPSQPIVISEGAKKATGLTEADHQNLFERCPWLDGNPNLTEGVVRSNTYDFRGLIDASSVDDLIAAVNRGVDVVRLNSSGGNLGHAMRAYDALRLASVDTVVSGICASACSIIFLAGETRQVPANSKLGVHQWVSMNDAASEAETQLFAAEMIELLERAGVEENLFIKAAKTPPSSMYWLSQDELTAWGVTRSGVS